MGWDHPRTWTGIPVQGKVVWIGQFWWWSRDITLTLLLIRIWSTMAAKMMQIGPKLLKIYTKKDQVIDYTPHCLTNYIQSKWDEYQKKTENNTKNPNWWFPFTWHQVLKVHSSPAAPSAAAVCVWIHFHTPSSSGLLNIHSNMVRVAGEMLHWSKENLSSSLKAAGTFSRIL